MRKLAILASVVVLVASSVNCGNSPNNEILTSPSLSTDATQGTEGKGGNGGKPGPGAGSGGSITLKMVTDPDGDGVPNWGEQVTFNVSTTATTQPQVSLQCSQ